MTVYFDTLIQAPREFSKEVQLIFVLKRNGVVLPDMKPRIIKMQGTQPDFEEVSKQRIGFNFSQVLTTLTPPLSCVIEVRAADSNGQNLRSVAWTVMPLFNPAEEPNFGRWRLPTYKVPTNLSVDMRQIPDTPHHSDMMLLLRIGTASDPIQNKFNAEEATKNYYELAPFHKEYVLHPETVFRPESPPHP